MIAICSLRMAAGCASALMFASIVSGALISLLLFFWRRCRCWWPRSDGARSAPQSAASRRRVHWVRSSACPMASAFAIIVALPAWWLGHLALARTVRGRRRSGDGTAPVALRPRMVSGRPHPALDLGLCRADHGGGAAHVRHRCWHRRRCDAPLLLRIRHPGDRPTADTDAADQCAGGDGTGRRPPCWPWRRLTFNLWLAAKSPRHRGDCTAPGPT